MEHRIFSHAIVRKPGENFSQGLSTANLGKPDYHRVVLQHEEYCKALEQCGLTLKILPPDLKYPDGTFVEDTAIVTEQCAILTNLGDQSRRGEEQGIKEILAPNFKIEYIEPPGTIDGGDVLRIRDHFFIGLSSRTNLAGAQQLNSIFSRYGYSISTIPVANVLHLQTGITYIGDNTIIALPEFAHRSEFKDHRLINVVGSEKYAANCLRINDYLLIPVGFPKIKTALEKFGFSILELNISEFQKMDGGLTCLSIRY